MSFEEQADTALMSLKFNIMPERSVIERLRLRQHTVTSDSIECLLDREYLSEMAASPSHLTMIVLPMLIQRLTYIYCCTRLNIPYRPGEPELLKIWPDRVEQYFPKMLRCETNLVCRMQVVEFRDVDVKRHYMAIEARVNDLLTVKASAAIFVL